VVIVHGIKIARKLCKAISISKAISTRVQMPLNTDRRAKNAAEYGHLFNIVVQINLIISLVV
jgi:hypothetical protein